MASEYAPLTKRDIVSINGERFARDRETCNPWKCSHCGARCKTERRLQLHKGLKHHIYPKDNIYLSA